MKRHCAQWNQKDINRIGGHRTSNASESEGKRQYLRAHFRDHGPHQSTQQSRMLSNCYTQHHRQDDAERREAGEVFHRIGDHALDSLGGQQVFYLDGVARIRLRGGHANRRADPAGDCDQTGEDDE